VWSEMKTGVTFTGRVFGLPGGYVQLTYAVLNFKTQVGGDWNRVNSPFLPPHGVFCQPLAQTNKTPRLPALAEQFSVSMETIVHVSFFESIISPFI
jgi:hypothetical protein